MSPLPRPARRIKPEAFYTEYMPAYWDALTDGLTWPDWHEQANVDITDSDEDYTVTLQGGKLSAAPGLTEGALATFRISMDSWKMFVHELWPQIVKYTDKNEARTRKDLEWFTTTGHQRIDLSKLRDMPGSVHVHYTDDAGDVMEMTVELHTGAGPRVQINATDSDMWALVEARGKLVNLIKSKLQVDGDVTYLIKLARYIEGS